MSWVPQVNPEQSCFLIDFVTHVPETRPLLVMTTLEFSFRGSRVSGPATAAEYI